MLPLECLEPAVGSMVDMPPQKRSSSEGHAPQVGNTVERFADSDKQTKGQKNIFTKASPSNSSSALELLGYFEPGDTSVWVPTKPHQSKWSCISSEPELAGYTRKIWQSSRQADGDKSPLTKVFSARQRFTGRAAPRSASPIASASQPSSNHGHAPHQPTSHSSSPSHRPLRVDAGAHGLQSLCALWGITTADRQFMCKLNELSMEHSSPGFGSFGKATRKKLARQVSFLLAAEDLWPQFGSLQVRNGEVLQDCPFWQRGEAEYMRVLTRYIQALGDERHRRSAEERYDLLSDLGFHMFEDFLTGTEEGELYSYWGPDGSIFDEGVHEQKTLRRFFNYGPVLMKQSVGTAKSTLGLIPSRFGGMPPPVEAQKLRDRLRDLCLASFPRHTEPPFDQLYVNYYSSAENAHIDFHHDHHTCMRGVVAGVSLGSACEFQLRPSESAALRAQPLCIRVPRKSAFLMTGLSRWHLQHAIPVHRLDRISLTFRTVDRTAVPDAHLWDREWLQLTVEERANAHWPLVPAPVYRGGGTGPRFGGWRGMAGQSHS